MTKKNSATSSALSKNRWPAAPDVPTIDEAGLPGLYIPFWHAFWAPRGVPSEVVIKLNAAAVAALADTKLRQRLTELGQEDSRARSSDSRSPSSVSTGRD